MFQWSIKWVSRVFKRSSLGGQEELQRCFKDFSWKFYGVSSRTEGLRGIPRDLQGCFKEASKG